MYHKDMPIITAKHCLPCFLYFRSAVPPLPKLQVVAFFAYYVAEGIRTNDLPLTYKPSLPLDYTLTCVYTSFSFPTYYTKPSVNCLFETLNEFKLKSCQLQRFITLRDLQLSI